jgi:hypothetical protein
VSSTGSAIAQNDNALPYAAERLPLFAAAATHRETWPGSAATIDRLRSHLASARLDSSIAAVAVAGSLARMEFTAASDLDVIVILRDDVNPDESEAEIASESVWTAIAPETPRRPRQGGTYSRPITTTALADLSQLGSPHEQGDAFGKRINLLLASQPLYGAPLFDHVLERILEEYDRAGSRLGDSQKWSVLAHDVARHFHSVAANRSRKVFAQDPPDIASYMKFRFSVTLSHAAFTLLLQEITSRPEPHMPKLLAALRMTPMERVGYVCDLHNDDCLAEIANGHREFMDWSRDRASRHEPASFEDHQIQHLLRHAHRMQQALARLSLLQRSKSEAYAVKVNLF